MSSAQVGGHDAGSGIPPESGVDVKERDPHRMNQHLRVSSILQVTSSILYVPFDPFIMLQVPFYMFLAYIQVPTYILNIPFDPFIMLQVSSSTSKLHVLFDWFIFSYYYLTFICIYYYY